MTDTDHSTHSRDPDVQHCPHCGESITTAQRHFREDLVLDRYRTEFKCAVCGYHGEVFRHDVGDKDPDVMTDGGGSGDRSGQFDHPVRNGAMLRRRHESESTAVLMEIVGRFQDLDDDHYEYAISCPTRTGYHQYRAADLEDCFADTGLTNDGGKAAADDEIRQLYQDLHDEHDEHSFSEVVDRDGTPAGEECIHCGKESDRERLQYTCIDCGKDVDRYPHHMDIEGITPSRCTQCTFDRMGER